LLTVLKFTIANCPNEKSCGQRAGPERIFKEIGSQN
jgi:hypothetical protein